MSESRQVPRPTSMNEIYWHLEHDPKMAAYDLNNDPEIVARVKHILLPGEKLGQFYARLGLGRAQIMTMSRSEISDWVNARMADLETIERRNYFARVFGPKPTPKKLFLK